MRPICLALSFVLFVQSPAFAAQFSWDKEREAALEAAIANDDYQRVTSVLILHEGKAIYEGYFNGATADTRHNTRSVTKTINSMLVGAAVADRIVNSIDEPIVRFFRDKKPFENPDRRKNDITIEDLMTMSSALECDDFNAYSRGNEERMYLVEDMAQFYFDLPVRGFPVWSPVPEERKYGRAFSYCTAGANLVGQMIDRETEDGLEDYAQSRLFSPLGAADVKWPRTGTGAVMATGGLELKTSTLGKLGQLFIDQGVANGEAILPRDWIAASLQPRAAIDEETEYGYFWWLSTYSVGDKRHAVAYMSGNGGNRVMVLPDHDIVLVVTKTSYNTRGMHETTQDLFEDFVVKNIEE